MLATCDHYSQPTIWQKKMAKKRQKKWPAIGRPQSDYLPSLNPFHPLSSFLIFFSPFSTLSLLCLSLSLFVYLCLTLYFPVSIFVYKKLFLSLLCGPFFLCFSTFRFLFSFHIRITFSVCLSLPHSYSFS
jgi:hypothetical protein